MMMLTEEEREALVEQLEGLYEAIARIENARAPFDKAITALDEIKETLLEKHGVDVGGRCEGCAEILFSGDMVHVGED
jgi:hypothetical protein